MEKCLRVKYLLVFVLLVSTLFVYSKVHSAHAQGTIPTKSVAESRPGFGDSADFPLQEGFGTMPVNPLTNEEIMNSGTGEVEGVADVVKDSINSAVGAIKQNVGGAVGDAIPAQLQTAVGNNKSETLDVKATRAKILAGKLLSRLTKILAKEEQLINDQKSLGFASTELDAKVAKVKQDIDMATQKIDGLAVTPGADEVTEKVRIKAVISDVKIQLQLIKDDELDLLSVLK